MMLQKLLRVWNTIQRQKKTLAVTVASVLIALTIHSALVDTILAEGNAPDFHYLGTVEAVPGQIVEREYLMPEGGYVKTRTTLNDPQVVQRFIEAMQDAERLEKAALAGQP